MVLLATLVIFLIANTVPGDPVLTAARRHGGLRPGAGGGVPRTSGASICRCGTNTGCSSSGLLHGDLGVSISSRRPVLQDIVDYAPATLELATVAFLLSLVVACRSACWRRCGGTPSSIMSPVRSR